MRKLIIVLSIGLLIPLIGQEAKIFILDKSDTQDLSRAYRDFKESQKKWEDIKNKISRKYVVDDTGKIMDGWDKVEFSIDFKAMVPERKYYNYNYFYSPGISSIPAIGSTTSTGITFNGSIGSNSDLSTTIKGSER